MRLAALAALLGVVLATSGCTVTVTWSDAWAVGKYVLVFGAGVVAGVLWMNAQIMRGFGGW